MLVDFMCGHYHDLFILPLCRLFVVCFLTKVGVAFSVVATRGLKDNFHNTGYC